MAEICKQCVAEVPNKVGRLAEVTDKIKEAGVNIRAICAWVEGERGKLLLVAEDPEKACQCISEVCEKCEWSEVVCVKVANEPGALNVIARKLADAEIGINMVQATAGDAEEAVVILDTTDNAKAAEIL